ncbi:MAG: very short patch repair endonuclease [Actinomycetota bacterium]|nr:very short patch repair endonuclease [Actinomycetota bacterium]
MTLAPPTSQLDSWASTPGRRRIMQSIKSRDTEPEMALRRILHAMGLRYRVNRRPLPGVRRTADLVFSPAKVAVFMDGCFWHHCPDHAADPKTNSEYWKPKLERNVERDRETDSLLDSEGWLSVRVWEHEDPRAAAKRVARIVRQRRKSHAGR